MKYELIYLKRSPLIWVIGILYLSGIEQVISSMYLGDTLTLSLVGFVKASWLPLNFIMIPILLISMLIGESNNEVFEAADISPSEIIISKSLTLAILGGVILGVNILIFLIIALVSKVTLGYLIYQFVGYFINTFILLVVCSSLGLLLGRVINKHFGAVTGFISAILFFIMLCNFYKTFNFIVPLFNIRIISNSFDVISYDKSYYYHNVLWAIITVIMLSVPFILNGRAKVKGKNILIWVSTYLVLFSVGIFLISNIFLMKPTFYGIQTKDKVLSGEEPGILSTYFSNEKCGYYVDKYKMNVNIDNEFKNNCEMDIVVNGASINTLEFGLYEKLNISDLEINGEKLDYSRTSKSFKVSLPKEYKNGETIKVKIQYSGYINTVWLQGQQFFHVRNNSIFLADVFEWYPKLNDNNIKDYNVNIKYNGVNKIYSNLNNENKNGEYLFTGQSKEMFLVSNRMIERQYKDYLFVGNEEEVNNDIQCDGIIESIKKNKADEIKKIILVPLIPGKSNKSDDYKNAVLSPLD